MPELPADFNSWEHLQSVYMQLYNKKVDKYFSDVEGNGDLSSSRASVKLACRLVDGDNQATFFARTSLFFDVVGYSRKSLSVFYGSKFDTSIPVANHPQLFLFFSQDSASIPDGFDRVEHEKSVRLMKYACKKGEILPAITKPQLVEIAHEIKAQFMTGGHGVNYASGKISVSYTDPTHGFAKGNYWLVNSKAEGIELYKKLCNVIDVIFDDDKINKGEPEKQSTSQSATATDIILGKKYKKRAFRPIVNLRFRYAYVSFGNVAPPVFLIDTTGRNTALVY